MDWTRFINPIAIARWVKKQVDADRKERHAAAMVRDVARKEKELDELIELKKHNIEKLPDFLFLEASSIYYSLSDITKIAEIQFLITNYSIFDVTLHKFTARPLYEGRKLASIQDVEEHKISKQAATSFVVTYNLQEATVKELEERGKAYWQFDMHGYFHSEVRDFEKQQTSSLSSVI